MRGGAPLEPYSIHKVSDVDDLLYMAEHPDESYVLTQNIDLTAQTDWEPIGTEKAPFSGVLDGAGYTITVDMDKTESEEAIHRVGLFGVVSGTIANLNVAGTMDVKIFAGYVGPVAASLHSGTLFNCTSDVDVTVIPASDPEKTTGITHVGGLVGGIANTTDPSGTLLRCTNKGDIKVTSLLGNATPTKFGDDNLEKGTHGGIGGLVGLVSQSALAEITACVNEGDITVTNWKNNIGGILGQTSTGNRDTIAHITYCANKGDVTVINLEGERAAGIVGYTKGGTVEYCYNLGSITAHKGDGSAASRFGISGYSNNGTGNPLSVHYCYSASTEALIAEIALIKGDGAVAADNFYTEGRTEYSTSAAGVTAGTAFTDAADLTAKIATHPEASKGYEANPDGGYPMLYFEVPTSLEAGEDGYNGLISKTGLNNDSSFMTFLFQAPNDVGKLALSAQLMRGENMTQQVELTEVPEGETVLVGDRLYEAAKGYTLYAANLNSIPDNLWITAVLTAIKDGETVFSTTLANDNPVVAPGSLPEYPDGILSKTTYNAGPGLASDQYDETEEDSELVVISDTSKETYQTYIANLIADGYKQVSQREMDGNLYNTMSKDGENYYLYFTAYSNQVRIIWDKSSDIGLDELDTDPVGSGDTRFYLYSIDYTNSAKPLVDKSNQINCGALMLVKFPDNSLFVIDGGHRVQSSDAAQNGLMNFMYKITGQPYGSKINIKGWFFSHAHGDHVYFSQAFLSNFHDNIQVENVLFNFPSYQTMSSGYDSGTFLMKQCFNTYFPDANCVKLHTGQSFDIQGVNFQVLHTHEDAVGVNGRTTITDFNDTSTTLKMTINGKTFMLLGDSNGKVQEDMLAMYTDATLKSDAVQVAHHGYNNLAGLYAEIAAPLAFVPNSEINANGNTSYVLEGTTVLFADPDTYQFTVEDDKIKYETLPSYRESLPEHTVSDVVLNIGSNSSQRNITWYSEDAKAGTVQLAKKSDFVNGEFPTQYQSFKAKATLSSDGLLTVNKATISDLEENTAYVYRVGTEDGWSPIYSLDTMSFEGDFSFLLAGDPQIGSGSSVESDAAGWSNTLSKSLAQFDNIRFIVSIGDQVDAANNEAQYDAFLRPSALKSLPLATNMGNHEESGDSSYADHFNMPNNSELGVSAIGCGDYWFVYNNTLFMSLNSNNTDADTHKAFMQETIREHGQDADWKVVTFHHSIYSVANHSDDTDILERQEKMSPIFSELGIDVVLMGHDHVYTRTYMMNGTTPVVPEGGEIPASVTNPGESEVLYITANSASGSKYYNVRDVEFPYAAVKNQEKIPNITKIDVTDDSFTVTTYRVSDMSVMDTFTIQRTPVVNSISVTPDTVTVQAGSTQSFKATVEGINNPAQTVTWTVSGNESDGTKIDANGVLTVAADETATRLTVTATSTVDTSKSGTASVTVTLVPHHHNLAAVTGKDATCTEAGNIPYWKCSCGKLFSDENGTVEITLDDTMISATGHNYGEPVWNWSDDAKTCEVVFTCQNDSDHKETPVVTVNAKEKSPATCTEMGVTTYTATVIFNGKTYTATKDVTDIAVLGHGETELKNAKEATCTEDGYTGDKVCVICGKVVEKGQTVEKKAHDYQDGKCTVCGAVDPNYVPTKPTDPDEGDTDTPQTGDSSNMLLYAMLCIGSGALLTASMALKKKKAK